NKPLPVSTPPTSLFWLLLHTDPPYLGTQSASLLYSAKIPVATRQAGSLRTRETLAGWKPAYPGNAGQAGSLRTQETLAGWKPAYPGKAGWKPAYPGVPRRLEFIKGSAEAIQPGLQHLGLTANSNPKMVWHLEESPRNHRSL